LYELPETSFRTSDSVVFGPKASTKLASKPSTEIDHKPVPSTLHSTIHKGKLKVNLSLYVNDHHTTKT